MHKSVINLLNIKNQIKQLNVLESNYKIIAVSKTFPLSEVLPLIEFGHVDFGENKIQEAILKWEELKINYPTLQLHMLGNIQSNKVKHLIPLFDYVHSLDNISVARKISNEQLKKKKFLKIFIQVNIGNEGQKNGIEINKVIQFYEECVINLGLNIVGLMCLPPKLKNPKPYFLKLKDIAQKINLNNLSMGMSGDYIEAIKCGSNYLRIGSSIFGTRS